MRHIAFPMTLILAVVLTATPAGAQSREERDVRALLDRIIQSANSVDEKLTRQVLGDHSASGGPYFPISAMSLGSTKELEPMIAQAQAQVTARTYATTSPITVRADKNHAWAAYTWRSALTFKDGTQFQHEGRSTITFVREGKNWKVAHWHNSVVVPPPLGAAAREAEAQKIIEIERKAWEAIKNKQVDAVADYFADDASVFNVGQAYRLRGKAQILSELGAWLQQATVRSYQILEPQVEVLGDMALLTYYFTEAGVAAGKDYANTGKITVVFVKEKGAWRALHEHNSLNR